MLPILIWMALPLVTLPSGITTATEWLASSHPRIKLQLDHSSSAGCAADCDRYLLVLNYRSSVPADSQEVREWITISSAGCLDLAVPGRTSFACKQASSTAGTLKNGQRYALLRYHLTREQVTDLSAANAVLRLQDISFRLAPAARAWLVKFLQADSGVATAGKH